MVINQYDVFLINLNPTIGHEIKTVDKLRLIKKLGKVDKKIIEKVKLVIQEMLVD